MTPALAMLVALAVLYMGFFLWYGGKGKPLNQAEIDGFMQELGPDSQDPQHQARLAEVRALLASDDGQEFVMQNLARYRAKALYPLGYKFDDDPRAADKRYGRAIVPHLLRYGNVPIFIARRSGSFIEPLGADAWHYVAMVRYRSRRDFLRFAMAIERADIVVHKWAALEKTHVFPVKPVVSLFFVRSAVAVLMALAGAALYLMLDGN
jgi:hypothetical protein